MPTSISPVDPLALLEAAVRDAAAQGTLDERLRTLLGVAPSLDFPRAVLGVRGEGLRPVRVIAVGLPEEDERAVVASPVTPAVWRRRLRLLARRAGSEGSDLAVRLDDRDPWVRDEFAADLAPRGDAVTGDVIVVVSRGRDGEVLATLVVERGEQRAPDAALATARLLARHLAQEIAQERLASLADRRAERLQRLNEAGAALGRSLDEQEIVRELARQIARLLPHDGLVIAHPDLERGRVRTGARLVRGAERPYVDVPLGEGIVAEAARTGRGVRVTDYAPARAPLAARDDLVGEDGPAATALAAPMRVGTHLVGVVAVWSAAAEAYGAEDDELLRTVAAQAATAIANARLYAASETERRQTQALAEVARAVGESLRLGEVLRLTLRHSVALLRAQGACVALRRDDLLHIVAAIGGAELLAGVHLPMEESVMGRAVRDRQWLVSNDVAVDPDYYRPLQHVMRLQKAVIVPLVTAAGAIGVIAAINRDTDFVEEDARVLQRLADHVGVAIMNARLFEEVTSATREWRATFDAIATGVAVVDEQGRVARCNLRAAELAGAPEPKALLGEVLVARLDPGGPAWDAAAPDLGAQDAGAVLARSIETREPARATVRVSGGRLLDLVVAPHPAGGAVVAFDDVTAERERAAALARSDARYTRLVEAASDGIVTVDAEGRVTSVNRAFEKGVGMPRERLLGMPFPALAREEDADMRRVFAETMRGERVRREVRFVGAEGDERVASVITAPIVEDGAVVGGLAVLRDVTDERRMAEQLLHREKLAAMGQLVSGVAQELRNPLDAVLAHAELVLGALSSDDALAPLHGSARIVHEEATRAARIVDRLLAFARPRAPERASADVNRVLLDALELRRFALRAQRVDIALELDYDLPAAWADAFQLTQVFVDLLTNAEHALARGGAGAGAVRRVSVRTRRDGDALAVTVADTGPGLSDEQRARVFQPFFTTKPVGEGAGFGLAIADRIVRAHGGTIVVESAPGRGAAFTVRLPIAEGDVGAEGAAAATGEPTQLDAFTGESLAIDVPDDGAP